MSHLSLAGLDFTIRARRYDQVSESGARELTETMTGRTPLDGAVAFCGRRAVGSLELELRIGPNVARIPLGMVSRDRATVRFVMLVAPDRTTR